MKILLVGLDFYHIDQSFQSAINELGYETRLLSIPAWLGPSKHYWPRIKQRLGIDISDFIMEKLHEASREVKKAFDEYQPDAVIVIKGSRVDLQTARYMQKRAATALILSDSLINWPYVEETIEAYDLVYSFDCDDIASLSEKGIDCGELLGAVDTCIYSIQKCEKDISVFFVGNMYPERRTLLTQLVQDMPDVDFTIYGEYAKLRHPIRFIRWLFDKRLRDCFKNEYIPSEEVNGFYNRSKIVLNIHEAHLKNGWNARLPEILASGSFQIVDSNPAIESEFGQYLATFKSIDELEKKIRYYLEHDEERTRIAQNGYAYALKYHTLIDRVSRIMNDIESILNKRMNYNEKTGR